MKIGELNRQVQVQTNTVTKDSHGGDVNSWVTSTTVWAKITNLTGGKLEAARQIDMQASMEIGTRFCGTDGVSGITEANRLVYNSQVLEIIHINDVYEQHRELIILVKEQIDV